MTMGTQDEDRTAEAEQTIGDFTEDFVTHNRHDIGAVMRANPDRFIVVCHRTYLYAQEFADMLPPAERTALGAEAACPEGAVAAVTGPQLAEIANRGSHRQLAKIANGSPHRGSRPLVVLIGRTVMHQIVQDVNEFCPAN